MPRGDAISLINNFDKIKFSPLKWFILLNIMISEIYTNCFQYRVFIIVYRIPIDLALTWIY